jgi:hypothetical protein
MTTEGTHTDTKQTHTRCTLYRLHTTRTGRERGKDKTGNKVYIYIYTYIYTYIYIPIYKHLEREREREREREKESERERERESTAQTVLDAPKYAAAFNCCASPHCLHAWRYEDTYIEVYIEV